MTHGPPPAATRDRRAHGRKRPEPGGPPRVHSAPISPRRVRVIANAPFATKNAHTTSTSAKSARLLRSRALRKTTDTPFFDQPSRRRSGGCPNRPFGSEISIGGGEEPTRASTSGPRSAWVFFAPTRT